MGKQGFEFVVSPTRAIFTPAHLRVVAEIIRTIPESDVRQVMANHFGQAFNRRNGAFDPSMWQGATGGTMSGPVKIDGDSPGIPAEMMVAPRTDLMDCRLDLGPGPHQGHVTVWARDYAGAGRIFKWLQGEVATARRKIHG